MKTTAYNVSTSTKELQTCFNTIHTLGLTSVEEILNNREVGKHFYEALYAFLSEDCFSTFSNTQKLNRLIKQRGNSDFGEISQKYMTLKHDAFMNLLSEITRGENKGRIRLDTILQDKPCEAWIPSIHMYVKNNIINDAFKKMLPVYLDKPALDKDDSSISVGDLELKSAPDALEMTVQSNIIVNDLCSLIVKALSDKPDELVAYSYALTNNGSLKSSALVKKMRRSSSAEQILADSLAQLEEDFSFQFENTVFDISLRHLYRIERILALDDKQAAIELSRACNRAGRKVRRNENICKFR